MRLLRLLQILVVSWTTTLNDATYIGDCWPGPISLGSVSGKVDSPVEESQRLGLSISPLIV